MLRTLSRPLCRLSRTTYRPISTAVRDGGIFYHPLSPPNPLSPTRAAWAITFLSQPPIQPASKEVVGWLPAESETAEVDVGLEDFKENDKFIDLLHSTIKESLIQNPEVDTELVNEAAQRGGGWMHIFDYRNPPPMGRTPLPEDIIGSIMVEDGKIVPESYQPMPSYRSCTRDGLTQLSEGLSTRLMEALGRERKAND